MIGWIKIHRKLLEWEWYDDYKTFRLFIHLLLKANHQAKNYKGTKIERGQIMTGLKLLSEQTGLSMQQVRSALINLKSTNEITNQTSNKGTIIQIVKYKDYQVLTNKPTNEQQTDNKPITTNKNIKNDNNDKESIYNIENVYEFLKLKNPAAIEIFEMNNKKSFAGDYEKFITNFNSIIIENDIKWEPKILLARLWRLNANWDKTPKKNRDEKDPTAIENLDELLKIKT